MCICLCVCVCVCMCLLGCNIEGVPYCALETANIFFKIVYEGILQGHLRVCDGWDNGAPFQWDIGSELQLSITHSYTNFLKWDWMRIINPKTAFLHFFPKSLFTF